MVEINKNIKYKYRAFIFEDKYIIYTSGEEEPGVYKITLNSTDFEPNRGISSGINDSNLLIFGMSIDQISLHEGTINGGAEIAINLKNIKEL